jgi:TusA-related sulfurtransferase
LDKTVDARGLLCPEPVLLTKKVLDKMPGGVVRVVVDNNAARENVTRLAENKGWKVEASAEGYEVVLTLKK